MSARSAFVTDDGRLRAPWRIVLFLCVVVAAYLVASTIVGAASRTVVRVETRLLLVSAVTLSSALVATAVMLRWVEHGRSWSFVGLGRAQATPTAFAGGWLLGALAIGIPSALLLLTHQLRVVPAPTGSWWDGAWSSALLLLPAALSEELMLRGYLFAVLRETVGWKWTLVGTSIAFGLLHLGNPGATAESMLLVILAGFFLGAILLATGSLYAAWMAHFAWNWVMAGAMHAAVSGLGVPAPDYRVVSSGPAWLTGGSWGPEGGVAAGVSLFACVLVLHARYLRHVPTDRVDIPSTPQ